LQTIASSKSLGDRLPRVYDRALLLHGSKRNEVLSLAEIEQYGADSFGDADYVSIYGMRPREWYSRGIRLLGRTAVECTGDALGKRIALDVVSVAARMPLNQFVVIDAFAGSCNTLFWILRHLPNSQGIAFESDPQVFELTHRTVRALGQRIDLVQGDYVKRLAECRVPEDQGVVVFVAPPWGTALDEVRGLDLSRTAPPISEVIQQLVHRFSKHKLLFATQVYEKVCAPSLIQVQARFDWSELRLYNINEKGRNHGILLGTKGWAP
jgi:predicted RNA methylase